MSTQITVDVKTSPEIAFDCACQTLLSFQQPDFYISNHAVMTVSAQVFFRTPGGFTSHIKMVMITICKSDDETIKMSITADYMPKPAAGQSAIILFIAEFLNRYSTKLTALQ